MYPVSHIPYHVPYQISLYDLTPGDVIPHVILSDDISAYRPTSCSFLSLGMRVSMTMTMTPTILIAVTCDNENKNEKGIISYTYSSTHMDTLQSLKNTR